MSDVDLPDIKGYAKVAGQSVLILSEDVGGLTLIARWVRSDSITDRTEEFDNWRKESDAGAEGKFYEDRIAHLDEMLVKSIDMNRALMEKLSRDNELIEHLEERRLNSQKVAIEEQRKRACQQMIQGYPYR